MIPVNEPALGSEEAALVSECLRTGWISSAGHFIDGFEEEWARYCGMKYGVAVSNGTVALQLAVQVLGIGPGDEVILPSFTIISCAQAVVLAGATPVLVDADPHTWTMDVSQIESRITHRTKAIMAVHIYGHPVDMDPLRRLAASKGLLIIEDAAEAHGGAYYSSLEGQWKRCGSLGDISIFSFYANKIVTTGEGGMLLTNSDAYARKARSLRNLCFIPERRFLHRELGFNFRLTNIQAAIGIAQVRRIDSVLKKKRWIAQRYLDGLRDAQIFQLPVSRDWAQHVYWMFGLVLNDGVSATGRTVCEALGKADVETRPFFLGMHSQPVFASMGLFGGGAYPVTDRLAERGFYLPSGVALTPEQVDQVISAVRGIAVELWS